MLELFLLATLSAASAENHGAAPVPPPAVVGPVAPVAPAMPHVSAPVVAPPVGPSPVVVKPPQPSNLAGSSTADAGTATALTPKQSTPETGEESDDSPHIPPSLSQKALCAELRRSSKDRSSALRKLEDERKGLVAERERLKVVQAEIVTQREALRAETARLEGLMDKESAASSATPSAAPSHPGKKTITGDVDSLAKTVRAMKAEQAAVLLAKLDRDLGAQVLAHMRPADAGAVLDKVKPELAAELMANMATLPHPKKVAHP